MNFLVKALYLKRPFDILLSSIGLVLSLPLWLIISFLIWLEDRGPIFFKQVRIGKDGRIFNAYKFRSMVVDAEEDDIPIQAVQDDPRVTKAGKLLRKTALDELPQLINIFIGDMSFVGPRALRPEEKETNGGNGEVVHLKEIPGFSQRHESRPGLTGLAQIYLPADAPRQKKFQLDLMYINKRNFWLDLKLILVSFLITFRAKWESSERKI